MGVYSTSVAIKGGNMKKNQAILIRPWERGMPKSLAKQIPGIGGPWETVQPSCAVEPKAVARPYLKARPERRRHWRSLETRSEENMTPHIRRHPALDLPYSCFCMVVGCCWPCVDWFNGVVGHLMVTKYVPASCFRERWVTASRTQKTGVIAWRDPDPAWAPAKFGSGDCAMSWACSMHTRTLRTISWIYTYIRISITIYMHIKLGTSGNHHSYHL